MPLVMIRKDGGVWTFDGHSRESFQPSSRITDHPVEGGGNVADNIFRLPLRLTIEAKVTESPLRSYGQPLGRARVDAARSFLRVAQEDLVTIQTELETLTSMAIVGWSHDKTSVGGVAFKLEMREIVIANSATVEIPADEPAPAVANDVASAVDAGEQPTEDIDTEVEEAAQEEENQSTLAAILDAV